MLSAQFQLHADIEVRHWWFVGRRQIMTRLVQQLLPPSKQTTIIDVGCGTGANIAALADDYRCLGIDTSAEAIGLARQRFPIVQFVRGFAPADVREEMGCARAVLLMDVLEHVPDDFSLLSELLAATSPGTYFLVTVPAEIALWSEHDVSFGHYRRYDMQRLRQVWQGLPVSTLLASYYNARLLPAVRMARQWSRFRGGAAGVAGTDFRLPLKPLNVLLQRTFAGEGPRLVRALAAHGKGYRRGVSLIAVLRREPGNICARTKPEAIVADYFDPIRGQIVAAAR